MTASDSAPLKIVHAVRAPVGGLFRHIVDLANGQSERGHRVGIIADSLTGGDRANAVFADMQPRLALGVHRLAIRREPHPADGLIWPTFSALVQDLRPDVLHGHGSKAGAFVRMKKRARGAIRVYTPHGGSLHYGPNTLKGKLYGAIERGLMNRTELFLFESEFARKTYQQFIGMPRNLVRCVFNGVTANEFDPVTPADDVADIVFVGELRDIKGPDLLIDAAAKLRAGGRPVTLTLAGEGDAAPALREQCERLGLADVVRFIGFAPARAAFGQGRILAVPSRGESMPYIVIEAAAAGIPIVAANVGGIPEIFGPFARKLVKPNDADALATSLALTLDHFGEALEDARLLRERVSQHFSQQAMVDGILTAYREALAKY